jgi:hypothetical protein
MEKYLSKKYVRKELTGYETTDNYMIIITTFLM